MVRILLCGDVRGKLPLLCDQIRKLHAKLDASQHFKAVFCTGEFSSEDMDLEVEPPIPVHFVDSGPAAQDLIEASPQGEEVSPNLHFLGHFGVATVAGLKVAFLSGRQQSDLFAAEGAAEEEEDDVAAPAAAPAQVDESLTQKYGAQSSGGLEQLRLKEFASCSSAGPSWEALKAKEQKKAEQSTQLFIEGHYTPLAVERLVEEIQDAGGIDLLLTSEWPAGFIKGVARAWPEEAATRKLVKEAGRPCSARAVAQLATAAEAKYHAVGLGGVFWRRAPWRHEHRGEVVQATGEMRCGACRMICLGAADGSRPGLEGLPAPEAKPYTNPTAAPVAEQEAAKPQKWLHGLDLDPNSLPAAADDATASPWSQKEAEKASAAAEALAADGTKLRPDFTMDDKEEIRRWKQRFGCLPAEMQKLADKIEKENAPKEKKEKHKSLYKVSEKEKKRRKTGGDGHLPFHAKERMASKG